MHLPKCCVPPSTESSILWIFPKNTDRDGEEPISDGFFFTVGYPGYKGDDLQKDLLRYGISTISLPSTGSRQEGLRVCVSMLKDDATFARLNERLQAFAADHPVK